MFMNQIDVFYKNFRSRTIFSISRVPYKGGFRVCPRGVQNRSSEVKNHDFDLKIDVRPPNILYNCLKPPRDLPRTCSNELWRFVGSKTNFSHILPSKWSKMTKNAQNRSFLTILKAKYGKNLFLTPQTSIIRWSKSVGGPRVVLSNYIIYLGGLTSIFRTKS